MKKYILFDQVTGRINGEMEVSDPGLTIPANAVEYPKLKNGDTIGDFKYVNRNYIRLTPTEKQAEVDRVKPPADRPTLKKLLQEIEDLKLEVEKLKEANVKK